MRCPECDCLMYPVCEGEYNPKVCGKPFRERERHRKSRWRSSLIGWPGPVSPQDIPTPPASAPAAAPPKPRVPLGTPHCIPCVQAKG